MRRYTAAISKALDRTRSSVAAQLFAGPLGKAADSGALRLAKGLAKAPDDDDIDPAKIAASLDRSDLDVLATDDTLAAIAADTVRETVARLGVEMSSDLVNQVNTAAVAMARARAAELVGMRVLDDGRLVENPDAEWAISDSTHEMIRDAIVDGLESNQGRDTIVDNILASGIFDEDRAEIIATTEIARVNSMSAVEIYKGARSTGVRVMKEWLLGSEACDECEANAAQGAIDLDRFLESARIDRIPSA